VKRRTERVRRRIRSLPVVGRRTFGAATLAVRAARESEEGDEEEEDVKDGFIYKFVRKI
jgi:hypothetical protein